VSDTGYGITASQQDKIFSKLFRADNVRAKDTEGTGLGLYIVKSIVDLSAVRSGLSPKKIKDDVLCRFADRRNEKEKRHKKIKLILIY